MSNINLNELRKEIDNRKKTKSVVSENLGENTTNATIPAKDEFLNALLSSLKTGQPSPATQRIKMVENKAAEKKGEVRKQVTSNDLNSATTQTPITSPQHVDRDKALYEELEKKTQEYKQGLTTPKTPVLQSQTQISENFLNESVKKIIDENFSHIVEHAMKDAIVDIYATERIKEVIAENENIIRDVVIKTIREIRDKNKKNKT